jgi:hypothetical protein
MKTKNIVSDVLPNIGKRMGKIDIVTTNGNCFNQPYSSKVPNINLDDLISSTA